jgi:predicted alpha/beta superfamily hydrolase
MSQHSPVFEKLQMIPCAIAILIITITIQAGAQSPTHDARRIDTLLSSDTLAEEVAISIYLPQGYNESSERYQCLYVLEDDLYHRAMTGLIDTKTRLGTLPELIVVGVSTSERWRDFTPTRAGVPGGETIPVSGGAATHRKFIASELVPYIDKAYRTRPYRILCAHSLAGLYALDTMLSSPGLFAAFMVTSPSLWWDDEFMTDSAGTRLGSMPDLKARLFIATGNEDDTIQGPVERFCALLDKQAPSGLTWTNTRVADSSHQEVPIRSFCKGLDFVYADWALPAEAMTAGIEAVDAHYALLSDRFGYKIPVPETVMNRLGYMALNAGNTDQAVTLFRRNVAAYPRSSNVHDSLGEAYSAQGQEELSRASYAVAESLATLAP